MRRRFAPLNTEDSELDRFRFRVAFAAGAVLLFNDQSPVGQGDIWGTPLKFVYDHNVFSLRRPGTASSLNHSEGTANE